MDLTKYKSVTINIETWKKLHKMADKDVRTVGKTIEYLVNSYKKKKGECVMVKIRKYKKYFGAEPPVYKVRKSLQRNMVNGTCTYGRRFNGSWVKIILMSNT